MDVRKLDNYSAGELADELGAVKADIADHKEREALLSGELIRRGIKTAEGELFRATVVPPGEQERIDRPALERDLGADLLKPYLKTSPRAAYVLTHGRSGERRAA